MDAPDFKEEKLTPLDQLNTVLIARDSADFKKELTLRSKKNSIDRLSYLQFEDRIWRLLCDLGATHLNKSQSRLIVNEKGKTKQIDIIARLGKTAFIIECKSSENVGRLSIRKDLAETVSLKREISRQLRALWGLDDLQIVYVYALGNVNISQTDIADAESNDIGIWDTLLLNYYEDLISRLGDAAKYQIFAESLGEDKEIPDYSPRVPAIKGTLDDGTEFYTFLARPDSLLKIAYIYHRKLQLGERYENPYQRMVSKARIEDIREFVRGKGYFGNNIIASFRHSPEFKPHGPVEGIEYGILTLPPYYKSLWIIDGQHRLFGFSNTNEAKTSKLPVFAFVNLGLEKQGNLFIAINKNQKKVDTNLLWDLYSDIYADSQKEKMQNLYVISRIVKKLAADNNSPFKNHIYVPSISADETSANIKMQTICLRIQRSRLINRASRNRIAGDLRRITNEETIDLAAKRISGFFKVIQQSCTTDWERGDGGYSRSNSGVNSLMIVFQEILKDWRRNDSSPLYNDLQFETEIEKYLLPVTDYINGLSESEVAGLKGSSEKAFAENARLLFKKINEKFPSFVPSSILEDSNQEEGEIVNPHQTLSLIEEELRRSIHSGLLAKHGPHYWETNIPQDIREIVRKKIADEIKKFPQKSLSDYEGGERRIAFCDIGDYSKIIQSNWDIFDQTYGSKGNVEERFRKLADYRNRIAHSRFDTSTDVIVQADGKAAIEWIAQVIGINLDS